MKYGLSFCPFVLLSGSFLGIGSLIFSETLYGVRGPYGDLCDRAQCFWKNPLLAKITKNGQKLPKNGDFGFFRKIYSLVLSGNDVE